MPNFNLVIDTSNFKPFDINPALLILHDYRDAYYRLEDQINKIAEEKGEYVLPETSKYRGVMDRYNSDFDSAVADFSLGMDLKNSAAIRNLRRRYYSEIAPIRKMAESYNKRQEEIAKLGPDAIILNRNASIDDFYGGINSGLNYRSLKTIQGTAAGVVQGLNNALMNAPELAGSIAKQYFVLKQQGINGEDALKEILTHNPLLNSLLGATDTSLLINALDKVFQLFAFEEGSPENAQIWEGVVTGAMQGILAPKYTLQKDENFESDAARQVRYDQHTHYQDLHKAAEEELEQSKARAIAGGYVRNDDGTYTYDPTKVLLPLNPNGRNGSRETRPTLSYGGRNYIINKTGSGDGVFTLNTYEVIDAETNQYITDAALRNAILNVYLNGRDANLDLPSPNRDTDLNENINLNDSIRELRTDRRTPFLT